MFLRSMFDASLVHSIVTINFSKLMIRIVKSPIRKMWSNFSSTRAHESIRFAFDSVIERESGILLVFKFEFISSTVFFIPSVLWTLEFYLLWIIFPVAYFPLWVLEFKKFYKSFLMRLGVKFWSLMLIANLFSSLFIRCILKIVDILYFYEIKSGIFPFMFISFALYIFYYGRSTYIVEN